MSKAYEMISKFYGDRKAKRSQVPLMNHINEGLIILDYYNADDKTKDAFCLHPIVQNNLDLIANIENGILDIDIDAQTVVYAMEYGRVANLYLLPKFESENDIIELSPLNEVNLMLKADKIQNRKDFLKYHYDTHDKSKELNQYFKNWLNVLQISEEEYLLIINLLNN